MQRDYRNEADRRILENSMRYPDIILVGVVVFNVCVVGPVMMVLWDHTVAMEKRTAILCSYGVPTEGLRMFPIPEGCQGAAAPR